MFISMTSNFGGLGLLTVTVSWQLKAYGIPALDVGILIVILNIAGMIGAAISGLILRKNKMYKKWSLIFAFGSAFFFMLFLIALEIDSEAFLYISSGLLGFCIFPYLTTVSDFSA